MIEAIEIIDLTDVLYSGLILIFLIIQGYIDIKKKEISIRLCFAAAVVFFTLRIGLILFYTRNKEEISFLTGLLPGVGMLLLSFITRGKIGFGDGLVIIVMGILMPVKRIIYIILTALFLVSVIGWAMIILGKIKRNKEIPFVPEILISTVFWIIEGVM